MSAPARHGAFALLDALAQINFANRNPSWAEYETAAPCDQRAIVARWREITRQPCTAVFTLDEFAETLGRLSRAAANNAAKFQLPSSSLDRDTMQERDELSLGAGVLDFSRNGYGE